MRQKKWINVSVPPVSVVWFVVKVHISLTYLPDVFSFLVTLELILIIAATIPLIVIPLVLLLCRILKNRSLKLKARLRYGKNYDRFGQNVTTNAVKDVLWQREYNSF